MFKLTLSRLSAMLVLFISMLLTVAHAKNLPFTVVGGEWKQSHYVLVSRQEAVADIRVDGQKVLFDAQGVGVLGIGRDAKQADIHWTDVQGKQHQVQQSVAARDYHVQRINGLANNKVNPNPKEVERIQADNRRIARARANARTDAEQMPALPFIWPVEGTISSVWGSQRVLNGEPRRPHFGVDIAAPEGTPIYAPAAGKVVLKDADMLLTGQTLMLDHGFGLLSIYIHMSDMLVQDGDEVVLGQLIGKVGTTGRSTGPHLHWGMTWHNVQVDASYLTGEEATYGLKVKPILP